MTAKWMKRLNRKELQHLAEGNATGRPTITSLKANLESQHKMGIRCFDCEHIARKLAIPLPSGHAVGA